MFSIPLQIAWEQRAKVFEKIEQQPKLSIPGLIPCYKLTTSNWRPQDYIIGTLINNGSPDLAVYVILNCNKIQVIGNNIGVSYPQYHSRTALVADLTEAAYLEWILADKTPAFKNNGVIRAVLIHPYNLDMFLGVYVKKALKKGLIEPGTENDFKLLIKKEMHAN